MAQKMSIIMSALWYQFASYIQQYDFRMFLNTYNLQRLVVTTFVNLCFFPNIRFYYDKFAYFLFYLPFIFGYCKVQVIWASRKPVQMFNCFIVSNSLVKQIFKQNLFAKLNKNQL